MNKFEQSRLRELEAISIKGSPSASSSTNPAFSTMGSSSPFGDAVVTNYNMGHNRTSIDSLQSIISKLGNIEEAIREQTGIVSLNNTQSRHDDVKKSSIIKDTLGLTIGLVKESISDALDIKGKYRAKSGEMSASSIKKQFGEKEFETIKLFSSAVKTSMSEVVAFRRNSAQISSGVRTADEQKVKLLAALVDINRYQGQELISIRNSLQKGTGDNGNDFDNLPPASIASAASGKLFKGLKALLNPIETFYNKPKAFLEKLKSNNSGELTPTELLKKAGLHVTAQNKAFTFLGNLYPDIAQESNAIMNRQLHVQEQTFGVMSDIKVLLGGKGSTLKPTNIKSQKYDALTGEFVSEDEFAGRRAEREFMIKEAQENNKTFLQKMLTTEAGRSRELSRASSAFSNDQKESFESNRKQINYENKRKAEADIITNTIKIADALGFEPHEKIARARSKIDDLKKQTISFAKGKVDNIANGLKKSSFKNENFNKASGLVGGLLSDASGNLLQDRNKKQTGSEKQYNISDLKDIASDVLSGLKSGVDQIQNKFKKENNTSTELDSDDLSSNVIQLSSKRKQKQKKRVVKKQANGADIIMSADSSDSAIDIVSSIVGSVLNTTRSVKNTRDKIKGTVKKLQNTKKTAQKYFKIIGNPNSKIEDRIEAAAKLAQLGIKVTPELISKLTGVKNSIIGTAGTVKESISSTRDNLGKLAKGHKNAEIILDKMDSAAKTAHGTGAAIYNKGSDWVGSFFNNSEVYGPPEPTTNNTLFKNPVVNDDIVEKTSLESVSSTISDLFHTAKEKAESGYATVSSKIKGGSEVYGPPEKETSLESVSSTIPDLFHTAKEKAESGYATVSSKINKQSQDAPDKQDISKEVGNETAINVRLIEINKSAISQIKSISSSGGMLSDAYSIAKEISSKGIDTINDYEQSKGKSIFEIAKEKVKSGYTTVSSKIKGGSEVYGPPEKETSLESVSSTISDLFHTAKEKAESGYATVSSKIKGGSEVYGPPEPGIIDGLKSKGSHIVNNIRSKLKTDLDSPSISSIGSYPDILDSIKEEIINTRKMVKTGNNILSNGIDDIISAIQGKYKGKGSGSKTDRTGRRGFFGKIFDGVTGAFGLVGKTIKKTLSIAKSIITAPFKALSWAVGRTKDAFVFVAKGLFSVSKSIITGTAKAAGWLIKHAVVGVGKLAIGLTKGLFKGALLAIESAVKIMGSVLTGAVKIMGAAVTTTINVASALISGTIKVASVALNSAVSTATTILQAGVKLGETVMKSVIGIGAKVISTGAGLITKSVMGLFGYSKGLSKDTISIIDAIQSVRSTVIRKSDDIIDAITNRSKPASKTGNNKTKSKKRSSVIPDYIKSKADKVADWANKAEKKSKSSISNASSSISNTIKSKSGMFSNLKSRFTKKVSNLASDKNSSLFKKIFFRKKEKREVDSLKTDKDSNSVLHDILKAFKSNMPGKGKKKKINWLSKLWDSAKGVVSNASKITLKVIGNTIANLVSTAMTTLLALAVAYFKTGGLPTTTPTQPDNPDKRKGKRKGRNGRFSRKIPKSINIPKKPGMLSKMVSAIARNPKKTIALLAAGTVASVTNSIYNSNSIDNPDDNDSTPTDNVTPMNTASSKRKYNTESSNSKASLGIRNNNPGNIELGNTRWDGMESAQYGRFVKFKTPKDGIRALGTNLKTYRNKHKLNTVRGIINRWSPAAENGKESTDNYISAVSNDIGIGPDDIINFKKSGNALVKAIIRYENKTNPYSDKLIEKSLSGIFQQNQKRLIVSNDNVDSIIDSAIRDSNKIRTPDEFLNNTMIAAGIVTSLPMIKSATSVIKRKNPKPKMVSEKRKKFQSNMSTKKAKLAASLKATKTASTISAIKSSSTVTSIMSKITPILLTVAKFEGPLAAAVNIASRIINPAEHVDNGGKIQEDGLGTSIVRGAFGSNRADSYLGAAVSTGLKYGTYGLAFGPYGAAGGALVGSLIGAIGHYFDNKRKLKVQQVRDGIYKNKTTDTSNDMDYLKLKKSTVPNDVLSSIGVPYRRPDVNLTRSKNQLQLDKIRKRVRDNSISQYKTTHNIPLSNANVVSEIGTRGINIEEKQTPKEINGDRTSLADVVTELRSIKETNVTLTAKLAAISLNNSSAPTILPSPTQQPQKNKIVLPNSVNDHLDRMFNNSQPIISQTAVNYAGIQI